MSFEFSRKKATEELKYLVLSLRPHQWVKNLFVFAALVFSHNLFNLDAFLKSALTFFAFCLISSAVYLLNDITDLSTDRQHPFKKNRPLAAGQLTIKSAGLASLSLGLSALIIAASINQSVLSITIIYLLLNILYSLWLKTILLINLIIVALGFVLRAMAGAAAIEVTVSSWLIICTSFLTLFLVIGKRLIDNKEPNYRSNFLNALLRISAVLTLFSYLLYVFDPTVAQRVNWVLLLATILPVCFGLWRYYVLIKRPSGSFLDPTEIVTSDKNILVSVFVWFLLIVLAFYIQNIPTYIFQHVF